MNNQDLLKRYVELCNNNLKANKSIQLLLNELGITESFLIDNFNLGFPNGSLIESIGNNKEMLDKFKDLGLIKNNKEVFKNHLVIPIYNEDKSIENITFYNLSPNSDKSFTSLNDKGIFNKPFLINTKEIILK